MFISLKYKKRHNTVSAQSQGTSKYKRKKEEEKEKQLKQYVMSVYAAKAKLLSASWSVGRNSLQK